ncbi:MAG: hypothetical protein WD469_00850 [Paenibacillaceae bacterium]
MKNKAIIKYLSSLIITCMLFSSISVAFGATASADSKVIGRKVKSMLGLRRGLLKATKMAALSLITP